MVEVVTPLLGLMLVATSKTGSVLLTVSLALDWAEAPRLSVMVAMQLMAAPGAELLASSSSVLPLPSAAPLASCHAKLGTRAPSS